MAFFQRCFLFFFVLFPSAIYAAEVDNLYQVELVIPQQQGQPSKAQLTRGFENVLIKVTGDRDFPTSPEVQQQLPNAFDYLQRYAYQAIEQSESTVAQQRLTLTYDPLAVDQFLKVMAVKPYGIQRPTLMLWLASDLYGARDYVVPESSFYQSAQRVAEKRALPLQVPLLDLQDQSSLPVSDLWGLFSESLEKASLRYTADAVLVGRIRAEAAGKNTIDWLFINKGKPQRFTQSGRAETLIVEMVDQVADQLLTHQVVYEVDYLQPGIILRVSNVDSFADYVTVIDFFNSLAVIDSLSLQRVNGTAIDFRIELDGSDEQLLDAIELEAQLKALEKTPQNDGSEIIHFNWQG